MGKTQPALSNGYCSKLSKSKFGSAAATRATGTQILAGQKLSFSKLQQHIIGENYLTKSKTRKKGKTSSGRTLTGPKNRYRYFRLVARCLY